MLHARKGGVKGAEAKRKTEKARAGKKLGPRGVKCKRGGAAVNRAEGNGGSQTVAEAKRGRWAPSGNGGNGRGAERLTKNAGGSCRVAMHANGQGTARRIGRVRVGKR